MNRGLLGAIVAVGMVVVNAGVSYGFRSFATEFKNTYPASPLSALSTTSGVAGNLCTVCHGPSGPPLNPFGDAFFNNGTVFPGLESLDSDGDTFSNITEINAGTFPGNPNSKPGDTTAPIVTAFNVPATAAALTVAINAFTATDLVGVTGYLVTETAVPPLATAAGWSATAPTSYTFASAGVKTLYAWAKDAAGNVSASLSAGVTVTLPNNAPTVNAGVDIGGAYETLKITLHAAASDPDGDVLTYTWTQTAGKDVSYVGATNTADVTFTVPVVAGLSEANLTFQVTVNDGKGGVASDSVNARVRLAGDCNQDDATDVVDLLTLVYSFNLSAGAPGFDPAADLNHDGLVDMVDLIVIANNFGRGL